MAEYYLKTSTYVYRVTYRQEGDNIFIDATHVAGTGMLPDGNTVAVIDQLTNSNNIVVDQILAKTSAADVSEYRTAVKAQIDASW
jgi:hypothetical protein